MLALGFYGVFAFALAAVFASLKPGWWLAWLVAGCAVIGAWMIWAFAIRECDPGRECTRALVLFVGAFNGLGWLLGLTLGVAVGRSRGRRDPST